MKPAELTELESRLAAIVDSSDDAIIGTSLDGQIESWNASAERILCVSRNEAIGRSIALVVPPESASEIDSVLARVAQGITVTHFDTIWVRSDNRHVDVSLTVSPIRNQTGGVAGASFIARDITQQKISSEAGLWLAAIVQSSDDAIVSKDLQGIVTSWNPAAERMFGWSASEAIGQSILIIVPEERRDEERYVLSRIRNGLSVDHFETVRKRKDGAMLDISLTVSPVKGADGRVIGASKIARDVTEQKRLLEEQRASLVRERDMQAEANRIKDEFLATLSHELRTPLNAIIGWSDLLLTQQLENSERQVALETIHRNARTQVQLVEDLLDVSRIVSGKLRLELAPVDLVDIAAAAIDVVRPAALAKGITIRTEWIAPHLVVSGDADRLQQIIWNLASNAVKFTPEGGTVTVTAELVNGYQAQLKIEDTGKGIPREFLPHVFDRFTQEDSTHTRSFGGLGLGLAIVRHLVEAHGGSVEARSEGVGRGATFIVALPAQPSAVRPGSKTGEAGAQFGLNGIDVLIVDDLADERKLLETILGRHGATTRSASSAADARDQLLQRRPDVVVSDIAMPGEDGHALARWIRGRQELSSVPCIALTAHARADDRRAAFDSGFDYYLAKPVDRARLVELIVAATRRPVKIA